MRGRTKLFLTFLVAAVLVAVAPRLALTGQRPDFPWEEDLRRVMESLPQGSQLRADLEGGAHGDGIHYPWMDEMRQLGVKRALLTTHFEWQDRPVNVVIERVAYYLKYDVDCARIRDATLLERIRASGLEKKLIAEAVRRTMVAHWVTGWDRPIPHGDRGICSVELTDDKWLPLPTEAPTLLPEPTKSEQLIAVAFEGEEIELERLTKTGLTRDELIKALGNAITGGDSCAVRTILQAGADSNARDFSGSTPLIEAAKYGRASVIKALLQAGADPDAKDRQGLTALWYAEHSGYTEATKVLKERTK